jgi:hypothetical protein
VQIEDTKIGGEYTIHVPNRSELNLKKCILVKRLSKGLVEVKKIEDGKHLVLDPEVISKS